MRLSFRWLTFLALAVACLTTSGSFLGFADDEVSRPSKTPEACESYRQRLIRFNHWWGPVRWLASPWRAWTLSRYNKCLLPYKAQNQAYLEAIPLERPSLRIPESAVERPEADPDQKRPSFLLAEPSKKEIEN